VICVDRHTAAPPWNDGLIDRRDIAPGAGRRRLRTAIAGRAIRGRRHEAATTGTGVVWGVEGSAGWGTEAVAVRRCA
jgi:hypothetical protein